MTKTTRISFVFAGSTLLLASGAAQVPDLLTAFDAGSKSLGMGGGLEATDADTFSAYYNPAGLGYIDRRQVGVSYRNLPTSRTTVTGTLADERLDSHGKRGSSTISHAGYAVPLADLFRHGTGTLALAYTIGGYISDVASGPAAGIPASGGNLNPFTVQNYQRKLDARADYYTLGWGRTNASQSLAYGVSLAYVQQKIGYSESGSATDGSGNSVPFGSNSSSTGNGFGAIIGLQYVPPKSPNTSWGISYRSEIKLNNNDSTSGLYDKIPARLVFGGAYRKDGLRGGADYLVVGAQVQHFFGGDASLAFDRSAQTTLGLGMEYNWVRDGWRIPIRIGYVSVPDGGSKFGSRNEFTYGLGYRPSGSDYSIDLNWGAPQGNGYDFAITAGYRFK